MGKYVGGIHVFQCVIVRQVATSEAPVKPLPAFQKNAVQELIARKLRKTPILVNHVFS